MREQEEMDIHSFIQINPTTMKPKRYDVDELGLTDEDCSLNMDSRILAYSDMPFTFDTDESDQLRKDKTPISLYVYDLDKKKKRFVAKSVFKPFNPRWTGTNILEYDNPKGKGRVRVRVSRSVT